MITVHIPPEVLRYHATLTITTTADITPGSSRLAGHLAWDSPTVVPGQPLDFSWSFWDPRFDVGDVTAQVYLGNNLAATSLIYTSATMASQLETGEDVTNLSLATVTDSNAVRDFYTIGAHDQLSLEVTGSGPNKGPYFDIAAVDVVGELISSNWWQWTTLEGTEHHARTQPEFAWKDDYILAGSFINWSKHTRLTGRATLYETESSGPTVDRGSADFEINRSGQVDVSFPKVKQDWHWLVPAVWIVNGPLDKTFSYRAKLTVNDQYGNTYSDIWSDELFVSVWVSDTKVGLGYGAEAAQIAAEVALFFSWIPGVGVAAATLAGAAAGLGAGALDPPEATPDYAEPLEVVFPELPKASAENDQLGALDSVIDLYHRLATAVAALSTIQGRLIGARTARDQTAVELQVRSYRNVLNDMMSDASKLPGATADAVRAIDSDVRLRPDTLRETLSHWRQGIPPAVGERAIAAGVPRETLRDLDEAIRYPTVIERAARGLTANLLEITRALLVATRAFNLASNSILAEPPPAAL